jgi:hypothetical protein
VVDIAINDPRMLSRSICYLCGVWWEAHKLWCDDFDVPSLHEPNHPSQTERTYTSHRISSHLIMAHIFSVGKKKKTNKQTNMRSQRSARSLHKSLDSPADEFNLIGPSQQSRESTSRCGCPTVVADEENQCATPDQIVRAAFVESWMAG